MIWLITGSLIVVTGLLLFSFIMYSKKISTDEAPVYYDRYYAMITDDSQSAFWQSIYQSAHEAALEKNAFVEMISENLSQDYSEDELMEIAIYSGVDGIIMAADESDEVSALINKAADANIPVVTLYSDNTHSERLSFVGIGNYNLGREYGNLIISLLYEKMFTKQDVKAVLLVDANAKDSGQSVLYAAIQESLVKEKDERPSSFPNVDLTMFSVDSTNSFSVEESVRSLFMGPEDNLPDIVICLNEIYTTSIYQAVVDYNAVGKVNILGYYDSDAILTGIERNVIYSTISVDTKQMGTFCVDALTEYLDSGNTSQYFTADIQVIQKNNVDEYRNRRDNAQED